MGNSASSSTEDPEIYCKEYVRDFKLEEVDPAFWVRVRFFHDITVAEKKPLMKLAMAKAYYQLIQLTGYSNEDRRRTLQWIPKMVLQEPIIQTLVLEMWSAPDPSTNEPGYMPLTDALGEDLPLVDF